MPDRSPPPRPDQAAMACALPLPLPQSRSEHVVLLLFRRMAIHGLHDARATMLALDHFGGGFLRALRLARAFLHGLARHAQRPIRVAPCCAPCLTRDEGLVMAAMVHACPVALLELSGPDGYRELLALAHAMQAELAPERGPARYSAGLSRPRSPDGPLPAQG